MHHGHLAFGNAVAAALLAVAAGCSRDEPVRPAAPEARRAPKSANDWNAAEIQADPVAFAEAAIRETEAQSEKLRAMEEKQEAARQKTERELAELDKTEAEARRFGRAALPLAQAQDTVYPVTVSGRTFLSSEALRSEVLAAGNTVKTAKNRRSVLENQAARDAASLADIRKHLTANAARKYELERKADAARSAIAERDLDALKALAGELADAVEAGLPSDEFLAPPVRHLGNDVGVSELEGLEF